MHVTELFHCMNSSQLMGTRCLAHCSVCQPLFSKKCCKNPIKDVLLYNIRLLMSADCPDVNHFHSIDPNIVNTKMKRNFITKFNYLKWSCFSSNAHTSNNINVWLVLNHRVYWPIRLTYKQPGSSYFNKRSGFISASHAHMPPTYNNWDKKTERQVRRFQSLEFI